MRARRSQPTSPPTFLGPGWFRGDGSPAFVAAVDNTYIELLRVQLLLWPPRMARRRNPLVIEEIAVVRYLSLLSFTSQGVGTVKDSPKRAKQFRASVEDAGGRVVSQYWAVGEVDGAVVFEAPDEQAATTLLLKLAQQGNVRTRSLRVYDELEFAGIVDAIG